MSEKFMCIGKKQDIGWIDWARFIGIYLVVLGHVLQGVPGFQDIGLRPLWDWIYLFHMPLFFVISGYLYRQTPKSDFRKIFFALVIPYLIYQLLYLPVRGAWKFVHPEVDSFSFWGKLLTGCLMGDGYETPISNVCCLPCWFIICIIQIRLLFCFIKITRKTTIILSILSVAFLYIQKASGIDLYCCLDSTIMALPYFLFGYWAKEINAFEKHDFYIIGGGKCKKYKYLALFVLVTVIYFWNGAAQMNGPSVGKDVIVNYLAGISGTLLVFNVSQMLGKLPDNIRLISRNTLFVIFFHWCCLLFPFRKLFIGENVVFYVIECCLFSLFILSLNYIAIKVLMIYCPLLLGKYKR